MKITTFNNLDEITGNEGKILLYDEAKSKIGASTETVNEIIQDQVGGDISRLEGRVDTVESDVDSLNDAIALKADADKVYTKTEVDEKFADFGGFEVVEGDSETGEPVVENPDVKKIYLVKKGTKEDKYCEWIWTKEEGSSENTWVLIGETTVELTDYAKTADVDAGLALKEDKVFVAEYNVTTYQEIKNAYDAGKQIVCKYVENEAQTKYMPLSQYIEPANLFIFVGWTTLGQSTYVHFSLNGDGIHTDYQVISNMYYSENETSGTRQLADAFNTKQDTLTFAGENNTITSINTSAVGKTLTAGTDLVIKDGVISVNTNGTAQGEQAFVEGNNTSAIGNGSHAEGDRTSAAGNFSHAEGGLSIASGNYSHAEGSATSAIGYESQAIAAHAEGIETFASGYGSHAEGYNTYAFDWGAHAEGGYTSAIGDCCHAEGNNTSAKGDYLHVEGYYSSAFGLGSHSEGEMSLASGDYSHAEGLEAKAMGDASHAEGECTIAGDEAMHVGGKYNSTSSNAAFVIGNGIYDDNTETEIRSDAFVVDWVGVASATKLATSGINDVETTIKSKLDTTAIQFVSTSAEAVAGTQGVIYIVTGTNA